VVLLAVLAVGLFIVLSEDETDESQDDAPATQQTETGPTPPAEPAPEAVQLKDGEAVGGVQRLTYTKGDQIVIEVTLDEPQEEIHIHGLDYEKQNPTSPTLVSIPAKIDGIFELEAHGPSGDVPLAEIVVNPG